MKNFKKLLSIALGTALMITTMTGCGSSQNRLDKIKASGKLVLATSPDFAPLEFEDLSSGEKKYVGSDIELAKYIAEKLGVELQVSAMDFSAVQAAIPSGQADIAIAGFAKTEEREKSMELSHAFNIDGEQTGQSVLVPAGKGGEYTKAEDFAGKKIGAQNGSLQYNLVTAQLPEDVEIVPVSNAELLMESHTQVELTDFMFVHESEGNVAAVKKGETELIEAINEIIDEVNEKGLYEQWKDEATELAKSLGIEVAE